MIKAKFEVQEYRRVILLKHNFAISDNFLLNSFVGAIFYISQNTSFEVDVCMSKLFVSINEFHTRIIEIEAVIFKKSVNCGSKKE